MSILALSTTAWLFFAAALVFACAVVLLFALNLVRDAKRLVERTRDARGRIRTEVAELSRETKKASERLESIRQARERDR